MQGSFSEESLEVFNKLASATQDLDYSESRADSYDFTRCVRPNGTAYGTGGKCKKGTEEAKSEQVTPPAMSTPTRFRAKTPDQRRQTLREIEWLDREIEKVKTLLQKKPSKTRHLKDLERQRSERLEWLQ